MRTLDVISVIWSVYMIRLREVTNLIYFLKKTYFPSYVCQMFWATIWYQYHAMSDPISAESIQMTERANQRTLRYKSFSTHLDPLYSYLLLMECFLPMGGGVDYIHPIFIFWGKRTFFRQKQVPKAIKLEGGRGRP